MKVFDIKPKKLAVTKSSNKLPLGFGRIILVAVVVGVLSSAIAALSWSNPTVAPPGGNLSGFLDSSSTAQTKTGALTIATSTYLATTGGNVGIGTITPNGLLDVNGKLTVLSSGNVGIGTTAPGYPLTVAGNNIVLGDYASIGRMYSGADSVFGNNVYANPTTRVIKQTNSNYYANWIRMYYNNGITFGTSQALGTAGDTVSDPAGTTNERMIITNAGNVGIGTVNPSVPLEVNGAVKVGGSETGNSTSDIKAYIQKIACQARRGVWVDNTGCTEYAYYTSTSGTWAASPCASGYHLCTWGDLWSGGFASLRRSGYWPATPYVWIAGAFTTQEPYMFYPWGYQNYNNSCVAGTHFMLDMLGKAGTNAWGCYVDSYVNVSACCSNSQ